MDMPTYQGAAESNYSGEAPGQLTQSVQKLAPLATTFVTPQAPQFANISQPKPSSGVLSTGFHFLGSVATTIGHMGVAAEQFLQRNLKSAVTSPIRYGSGLGNAYLDNSNLDSINKTSDTIQLRIQNLSNQYKNGSISLAQYKTGLADANSDMENISNENKALNLKINSDYGYAKQATIDTAATLVTIMTFGLGGEGAAAVNVGKAALTTDPAAQTAARYLMSKAAPLLAPITDRIATTAVDKVALNTLSDAGKAALDKSAAEVIAQGTNLSGRQIAQATAANLALKYPLMYNYLSSEGTQIYKDLSNKKYGAAVNNLAVNALIAIGGGIFGEALLKGVGTGYRTVAGTIFNRSAFTDLISKELFGNEALLANAARGNPERIKALSDLEATHLSATGGDSVAAGWRVINGERSVDGVNVIDKGPEGWLDHNIDWAKSAKENAATAKKYNLGPVSLGRWTASNARMVASQLSQSETPEGRLQIWEGLKQEFPDSAMSNSANLDRQIKSLIQIEPDAGKLATRINHIPAGSFVKGYPEKEARALASKGFLPINGAKHVTSYVEGSGKITTKFADGEAFFTKAVTPIPVLNTIGALFTKLGLSPYASTQRVSDLYTANLANNLKGTSVASKVAKYLDEKGLAKTANEAKATTTEVKAAEDTWAKTGLSAENIAYAKKFKYSPEEAVRKFGGGTGTVAQRAATGAEKATVPIANDERDGADYMRKILATYAKKPTRSFLNSAKIIDERQMTNKDIRTAFANQHINLSSGEAHEVQLAISRAHLNIDTAVKGLGDKAVDYLYSTPGIRGVERRFLRLQGSLRFSFNPFFQYLRAVPKLEILSEAEGGGFTRSLFTGRLKQMSEVREGLRNAGFLNETGKLGNVVTDEAVLNAGGGSMRNLSKQLLPAQENSVAGMVDALAQKSNVGWQEYIAQNPEHVSDLIQSIAEYSHKGDFLNSPLARTLNIAFFPFRFETKVLTILTKSLARQDFLTKTAFILGVTKAHDFFTSPEGQAWYSQNSDAIGLFNYVTPVASLNEVFHSLLPGHDHSLGNFGELGGLPFGWIPQILDAEGLTHFNQPGVNPKTGAIYSPYLPVTARGQVAIAIQDLLGAMFSYPGATAGLPSKGSITRSVALGLVGGSKTTDLKSTTPTLTPQQQQYSQSIMGMLHNTPNTPSSQPTTSQVVPARPTNITLPRTNPSSTKVKKLKKSQFTPQLLPGQSTLGQL